MDPITPVAIPPAGTATPAAPASTPAVTPDPAKVGQPAPAAAPKPGVSPEPAKPAPQMVPIASLLEERAKRQELEAALSSLRTQTQPPAQPAAPVAPQPAMAAQELEKLWENDPRRAVETTIGMAMNWYDRQNAAIEEQADQLAGKAPDFNNYRSATMRYVRSLPIEQRNNPRIVEAAYFYVRGQGLDELLRQRDEELMRKFQTGELGAQASLPPGTFPAPSPTQMASISPEEKAVADAMGISDDEYLRFKKTGGKV